MSLEQLIADNAQAEFDAKNFAAVLTILNSETVEFQNEERFTWAGIADILEEEETEKLRVALEANGYGFAIYQLGGQGLVLNHDRVWGALGKLNLSPTVNLQPLLDAVRYKVSPAVAAEVKQRGELVVQSELDSVARAAAVNRIVAKNNAAIAAAEAAAESELPPEDIESAAATAWGV